MKKIGSIFLALFLATACTQPNGPGIRIDRKEWKKDTVFIFRNNLRGQFSRDTVYTRNGKLFIDIPDNELSEIRIVRKKDVPVFGQNLYPLKTRTITLLVEPGDEVTVTDAPDDRAFFAVSGSDLSERLIEFERPLLPHYDRINQMEVEIQKNIQGVPTELAPYQYLDSIRIEQNRIDYETLRFLRRNAGDPLAAYLLLSEDEPTFQRYYSEYLEKTENRQWKEALEYRKQSLEKARLTRQKSGEISPGIAAPDFTSIDLQGELFRWEDYRPEGKYTVLEFWGSWCPYCVQGFPKMKSYYEKYREKLEIIGIACNDTEPAWRKAVQQHSLPWIQLFNGQVPDQDATVNYAVEVFPTKILLDPDKNIVSITTGETNAFYRELDRLLE